MRVINISLNELETKVLMIGFEGENQITQVRIDAAKILTDYPTATPTLIVKPLFGFAYPVIVTMEGTDVVWEIDNSVLSSHGDGEIQLTFTQGTVIAKSYVGRIRIKRSLTVTGEAPDPIETWEQAATAKLAEVDAQIGELEDMVEAAEAAKDQAQDIVDDAAADIQAAGAAQVGNVNSAGTTQVGAVQAKGEEVLNSIPADYSTLSGDVTGLKSAIGDLDELETTDKTSAVDAINEVYGMFTGDIVEAVADWLDDHPEATTTVQDHSLTYEKFVNGTLGFVTPEMYGAKGDGETDDTAAIQSALNSGKNVFLTGNYITDDLTINSDGIALYGNGSIKKKATDSGSYNLLRINGDNVTVEGITIIGDRIEHTGASGEHGACVYVGGNNASIIGCIIKEAWGDGIYIIADECNISRCVIDHCSRNGISIIKSDNFSLTNLIITNTNRTSPKYAIDIEPNTTDQTINGIISNVITSGNVGGSVFLSLQNAGTNVVSIHVNGVMSYGDCTSHTNDCGIFGIFVNSGVKLYAKFDDIYVQNAVYRVFGINDNYQTTEDISVEFNGKIMNINSTSAFYMNNASTKALTLRSDIEFLDYTLSGIVTGAGAGSKMLMLNTNISPNYPNISSARVTIIPVGPRVIDVTNKVRNLENITVAGECIRIDNGYNIYYDLTVAFSASTLSNFHFYTDQMKPIGGDNASLHAYAEGGTTDVGAFLSNEGIIKMNSIPAAGTYHIYGNVLAKQS